MNPSFPSRKKERYIIIYIRDFDMEGENMNQDKILVVYYSYGGNTEQIVNRIQKQKECDVLKL